jgi:hypothetical protein
MSAPASSIVLVCRIVSPSPTKGPKAKSFPALRVVHAGKVPGHKGKQIFERSNRLVRCEESFL